MDGGANFPPNTKLVKVGARPVSGRTSKGVFRMTSDSSALPESDEKIRLTSIDKLRAPLGGQEIELQQLDFSHGGSSLLRVRIREGKRFTIFDIDAVTARRWGEQMAAWAAKQEGIDHV